MSFGSSGYLTANDPWLPAGLAVDLLSQDVGVACVPSRLFHHVYEYPSKGHWLGRYSRSRTSLVEVNLGTNDRVTALTCAPIGGNHRVPVIVGL